MLRNQRVYEITKGCMEQTVYPDFLDKPICVRDVFSITWMILIMIKILMIDLGVSVSWLSENDGIQLAWCFMILFPDERLWNSVVSAINLVYPRYPLFLQDTPLPWSSGSHTSPPGVRVLVPPVARSLIWRAPIPSSWKDWWCIHAAPWWFLLPELPQHSGPSKDCAICLAQKSG